MIPSEIILSSEPALEHCTDAAAFFRILHPEGGVFEIRSINCPDRRGGTYTGTASGYFIDAATAAKSVIKIESLHPPAVYVTLNPVEPALLARAVNRIAPRAKTTSLDSDIARRRWLFVDIDSRRPSGISATDAELRAADKLSDNMLAELRAAGWPEPLQAMSGNGRHLLWRVDLPNDDDSTALVKSVLTEFARRFNSDGAEVDCSTFNASRIIKVAGTVARKGDPIIGVAGMEDRPHRQSWFIPPAADLEVVPAELLRDLLQPKPEPVPGHAPHPPKVSPQRQSRKQGKATPNERASKYLAEMEPSISGQHGAKKLFAAACKCIHKFGLSDADTMATLLESFNPRCEPPWPENSIERAIKAAHEKGKPEEPIGNDFAGPSEPEDGGAADEWGGDGLPSLSDVPPEFVAAEYLTSKTYEGTPTLRYWAGSFWLWTDGRYVELTKDDVRGDLVRYLQGQYCEIRTQAVGHALLNISARCAILSSVSMPRWLDGGDELGRAWKPEGIFVTRDRIIHLPSLADGVTPYSVPATPKYFSATAADCKFNPDAPPPRRWLQFLDDLFGGDRQSIELLRQWFGYMLTADTSHQKILLMVGPKRSGKGTIARLLRALVGERNCAAPTLAGLATNFGLQCLLGKTCAVIGDARLSGRTDVAATTERLLSISGEDAQTIDRKHREPITTQLRSRFTIISNELPRLNDASGALAGRLLLLRFTQSFYGRENKGLTSELMEERAGILLWAIGGWASLRGAGRFTEPASSRELLDQLGEITSPVAAFVADRCELRPDGSEPLDDLYAAFREWSDRNGIDRPSSKPVFSRDLTAAFPELTRSRVPATLSIGSKETVVGGLQLGVRF